jgi:hypothetical protein
MQRFWTEYGVSASARSRIRVTKQMEEVDPFVAYQNLIDHPSDDRIQEDA